MRITFLTWRDTGHPDGGGSEVYVEEVAARLVARGHDVTIRTASYTGAPAHEVIRGVVHRRSGGRLSVYVRGLAYLATPAGRREDVVVDVINGLPFAAPLVRRRGVAALVHHLHREQWSIIYPNWKGRLGWFVESRVTPRLYRRVPHVTVSEHSARDLERIGVPGVNISVVRNGLRHDSERLDPGPRSATPRLCVLSRLVPHKRIEHALQTVAALRDELPGLHLDIVGDGWWRDALVAEAARLRVTEAVTFHGHVPDRERDRILARSWVMLLPSVKEGWGIAVTEAAQQGTPTIGYRASGGLCESVVDGVTGVLVDTREELVAATRRLLADEPARRAMSRAAARVAETLDWDDSAERFEGALGTALTVNPRRVTGRRR
ncbi:glycosyl transferase [Intrasporangium oryzae NRRL B-24470]|uniref:Glycosyl transferase n=1 Tax=Intrasporangium oryzae NRRL B-24470 TaxID=1386089 RepID=W9G9K4_9MICO|nr:glycosyltransferase family 4 protein [Intrasporangium oryzae]EWT02886.1 glycosyl transferase [Intrasporangium oryzae NRRL B-24470]